MRIASTDRLPAMPPMPWAVVAAACLAMFAASTSGSSRTPFLIDMARDLDSSVALLAQMMAGTSIAWGISSVLAGIGSDRWGRRPFLVGAPLALAGCMVAIALAPNFPLVAFWGTVGGGCAGAFTGVIMTEVSARTVDRQRGRALGWVMAGQSLTLLVGVPAAAWIGVFIGWRGVHWCTAALAVLAALALLATTWRRVDAPRPAGAPRPRYGAAMSAPVLRLLAIGVAERICFGLTALFFATFLQITYQLSLGQVALPLALFALGSILGTVLGGQLADRLPNRLHVFAGAMFVSGACALPLFLHTPSLGVSLLFAFAYVLVNAVARPSLMAALAQVPEDVRGTVLGLNVTSASMGWLGAAALGGWMITSFGFAGFAPVTACMALLGGALALLPISTARPSG